MEPLLMSGDRDREGTNLEGAHETSTGGTTAGAAPPPQSDHFLVMVPWKFPVFSPEELVTVPVTFSDEGLLGPTALSNASHAAFAAFSNGFTRSGIRNSFYCLNRPANCMLRSTRESVNRSREDTSAIRPFRIVCPQLRLRDDAFVGVS
jgi:hypothetical protein